MFGDMMGKLKETQQKVEATKERMNSVLVDEQSSDGLFKATLTANRQVKNVEIHPDLLEDKEQLEDYIISVINKALDKAEQIHDTEVAAVAKEGMPNIPGMDLFQ